MSHIEIHKIKGREYKYEVTNFRIGKKVKHKWKYLGPVLPVNKKRRIYKGGRKPKLKVKIVSPEEVSFVKQNLKSSKSFIKDRARIINLSSEGKTVKEICQRLGFHRPKVEKIIKHFNELSLEIFKRGKSPGKPRRITKEERAKIIQFLNTEPEKLGYHFTNWSQKKLAEHSQKKGIKVSPAQVGRIIKEDEIKYKRKIPWLYSNDKRFAEKKIKD